VEANTPFFELIIFGNMTKDFQLIAKVRKGNPGKVRGLGLIPGVLYGHKIKNTLIQFDDKLFGKVYEKTGQTTLISLMVDDEAHNVLVREVQYHPVKGHVLHVDFYQVRMDQVVRTEVPLEFIGESAAVKDLGGVLIRNIDTVEVEALPKDLPHELKMDISMLVDFEAVLHVKDITLPKGVTIIDDGEEVIALVQAPRSEEELAELEEEVAEDVESVEGVAEKEEESEAGDEDAQEEDTDEKEEKIEVKQDEG
jgi:large subunit ribosomal protein L25